MISAASPLDTRSLMSDAVHKVLHDGDPTVGWRGDPRLVLTHSTLHGWELWEPSGDPENPWALVARQRVPNAPFNLTELIRGLAERDTHNREVDHLEAVDRFLAKVRKQDAERDQELLETAQEYTAKVVHTAAGLKTFW